MADDLAGTWLRVIVAEQPRRRSRATTVQELLPGALEVRIDPSVVRPVRAARAGRERGRAQPRRAVRGLSGRDRRENDQVEALFDRLHDEVGS